VKISNSLKRESIGGKILAENKKKIILGVESSSNHTPIERVVTLLLKKMRLYFLRIKSITNDETPLNEI